jgi:hypothetical protein
MYAFYMHHASQKTLVADLRCVTGAKNRARVDEEQIASSRGSKGTSLQVQTY